MIIKSDCIFDSVQDKPFKGYLIIEKNKIIKIGKGDLEHENLSNYGRLIDCGNKTVMPGFCDNHVHVFFGALDMDTCNLDNTKSEEEAAEKLFNFVQEGKMNYEWVIAFGWSHYNWDRKELPNKKTLDKFFPDRPVIAVNDELHALWVNSKALEISGVDKNTKDPKYSTIKRDDEGNPTGYILEQDAMRFFSDLS